MEPLGNPLDVPFKLHVKLYHHSATPLYQQISEPLEELIRSGEVQPGRLIEDEVSMAQRLDVSRPTARRALQDLVQRGLLIRRRGAGTRVTPTHVRRTVGLTSLHDDLAKSGLEPRTEVLAYEVHLATPAEAELLQVRVDHEVVSIKRRRLLDDQPLALLTNLLPAELAPTVTQLTHGGLYQALAARDIRPSAAQQTMGARLPTEDEAAKLAIPVTQPIMTVERTAYDEQGGVVEYGRHIYNPDMYTFRFMLTDG